MKRYEHINMVPTAAAQENARRALEVRQGKPASQRGMTPVGIARARDIANGVALSPETWRRVKAYFDRHVSDKDGETWGEQGKGWQAWMGWGGDENYATARRIVEQMDAADREAGEARGEWLARPIVEFRAEGERADGMVEGKPLRVIATGAIHDRTTGEPLRPVSRDDLVVMADWVNRRAESDPVVWNWDHAWAEDRAKAIDEVLPLGRAVEAWVEDEDGRSYLVVRSVWTPHGVDVLTRGCGVLWPSMEWMHKPAHDRDTGEPVSALLPIGIAVTSRPRYAPDRLSAVALNAEGSPPAGGIHSEGPSPEGDDMSPELMALMERLDALEARLGALESAEASDEMPESGEAVEEAGYKPDEVRGEVAAIREAAKAAAAVEEVNAKALADLRGEVAALKQAKREAEFRSDFADALVAGKVEAHERATYMQARSEQAAGRPAFFDAVFGQRAEGQFRGERADVSEAKAGKVETRGEARIARAKRVFEANGKVYDPKRSDFYSNFTALRGQIEEGA